MGRFASTTRRCALVLAAAALLGAWEPVAAETRPKTCLVLSGGGARGVAHIGVLKVLEEMRVPVDCIVGTSMGAIVGGAYATGVRPAAMEALVRETDWRRVLSDNQPRPERSPRSKDLERRRFVGAELGLHNGDIVLPRGAIAGAQLELFLQGLVGPPLSMRTFDDLRIPFRAIATNIETGKLVVLDKGGVSAALRASMSVPGVFAPQEIDGQLLADGGLVRNLGVDVARRIGAERVIAVNLGTPLLDRGGLESVFGITEQMINILTEQNVEVSLAQLGPGDVLILPELGRYSSANFVDSGDTILIGEKAALAVASQLESFAVDPDTYKAWRENEDRGLPAPRFADVKVETDQLKWVNPASAEAVFSKARGADDSKEGIERGIFALLATDDFQQVSFGATDDPSTPSLLIRPREKIWGPNYLRFGLTLSTDMQGESAFTLFGDYRVTWLNDSGLELRTDAAIGAHNGLRVELLQPFDLHRTWFTAVNASFDSRIDNLYAVDDDVPTARYFRRRAEAGLDIGRYFGTGGELRFGYAYLKGSDRAATGLASFPDLDTESAQIQAEAVVDRLDHWDFPRTGYFASTTLSYADEALGGTSNYQQVSVDLQKALGRDRHSLTFGFRWADSFGSTPPLFETFALGGFLNLSGLGERQLIGGGYTFGRAVYSYQLGRGSSIARRFYVGGSLEAGEMRERLNGPDNASFLSTSIYLAADSMLGPLYIGAGLAEGGHYALYLFLGRP